MRVKILAVVVPSLGLLASCAPPYTRTSGPAPENALSCAQASLERLGFASTDATEGVFRAKRTVEEQWVYRVEHVVKVSTPTRGTPVLRLDAERRQVKDLSRQPMQFQPGRTEYEPNWSARALDPDQQLKNEVEQVILDCGGSVQGSTGMAR